jgi:predicted permease
MGITAEVVSFIEMFLFLVAITIYLRWRKIITASAAPSIARLVMELVLPALLIRKLSHIQVDWMTGQSVIAMIVAELIVGVLAFLIARYLFKLKPSSISVFILCSTFGSTALLGNTFIKEVYHDNLGITAISLIIGQLAVGVPNNLLGPALTLFFCQGAKTSRTNLVLNSIINPPLISIIIGIFWGLNQLPTTGAILSPFFEGLKICGDTLPFFSAVLTGLSLQKVELKGISSIMLTCCILLLVIEPTLVNYLVDLFGQPVERQQITFLLAALPASPLIVAFAFRYGGDQQLAGTLVLVTTIVSGISLPLMMPLFDQFRVF